MNILLGLLTGFMIVIATFELVFNPSLALWLKYDLFNRKPFNCNKCLNFWCGIIFPFIPYTIFDSLTVAYLCSSIGITLLWTILFTIEENKK